MGQEARVSSIPVLKQLRASLGTFAKIASLALEETSTAIHRTRQWLREDQYRFWRTQVQARAEQHTRAKLALHQRQVFERTLAGTPSSCVDEKKALRIAEARLREAERKLQRVRAWSLQIERELSDYRAGTQRLLNAVDVDIPNARARLDKMIDSLEAYLALAPPEMPRSATEPPEVDLVQPGEAPAAPEEPAPAPPGPAENLEAPPGTTPAQEDTAS
ncbi:MAG: hypothetical protein JW955_00400 [Sedimentisphaerales bacterium]|nr:hypothetical protein [Sedimentisphaerales bacterium]